MNLLAQNFSFSTQDKLVELTSNSENGFSFTMQVKNLAIEKKMMKEGEFYQLSSEGFNQSVQVGQPNLPIYRTMIEIPSGSQFSFSYEVIKEEIIDLDDHALAGKVFPKQASLAKKKGVVPVFEQNKSTYNTNAMYSQKMVAIQLMGMMRAQNLGRLELAPFAYNPVSNEIKVATEIRVNVVFEGGNKNAYKQSKAALYSPAFTSMNERVLNSKVYKAVPPVGVQYPLTYVIVADSNYRSTLKPFVQWKSKQGYKIIEAYLQDANVGYTTTTIKSYLQGLYTSATATNPAPSYLLIIGDHVDVPAFNGTTGSHISDMHYVEFTNDFMPEMYVGRFSVSNSTELTSIINKTLTYEKYLMSTPSYLGKSVLIAGQDNNYGPVHGDGQINYATNNYFNSANGQTPWVYLHATSASAAPDIISNINNGAAFVNYTAHGSWSGWVDPALSVSNANSFTNNDKYPIMVANACETSRFEKTVCIAEALTRGQNKGAVAYIGGTNNTFWDEDFHWSVGNSSSITANPTYAGTELGAYDRVFHTNNEAKSDWIRTLGEYIYAGNMEVVASGSNRIHYYWEIYHLMGDPSLVPYWFEPSAMNVVYVPLIPLGSSSYSLTAEPYAVVGLSLNGQLLASAVADSTGSASLSFPTIATAGTYDLVVTAQNKQPWMGQVTVTNPNGPYVVYKSFAINDVTTNNNQAADFGETIDLDVEIQNLTSFDANSLVLTLQCANPMVTLIDSTYALNLMQGSSDSLLSSAFTIKIDSAINDQQSIAFTLKIEDGSSNMWLSYFQTIANAPSIAIASHKIVDNASGNANGKLDPGEQAQIWIAMQNNGHADMGAALAELTSSTSLLTVNNQHNFTVIQQGSTDWAVFDVTVDASAVVGNVLNLNYQYTNAALQLTKTLVMVIGSVDEDFETGDFSQFAWQTAGSGAWAATTSGVFEGIYSCEASNVSHSNEATMSVTMNVLQDDSITFFRKVSSESGYDFLKFYIDNQEVGSWSGVKGWSKESYPVSAGVHTFKWAYEKDYGFDANADKAWVDFISFPVTDIWSGVEDANGVVSMKLYPNPAKNRAYVGLSLPNEEQFQVEVYNMLGQLETSFSVDGRAGGNTITISTADLSDGMYMVVLKGKTNTLTQKLYILK